MRGTPTDFWGKLAQVDGVVEEWHPLEAHCADVAACCEALLRDTQLGPRLAHLLGERELHPILRARLVVLAALHDLGKYAVSFQNRPFPDRSLQGGHIEPIVLLLSSGGGPEKSAVLAELAPLEVLGDGWCNYLAAAISHHGRPEQIGRDGPKSGFDPRVFRPSHGLDPVAGIRRLVGMVRAWCPEAFEPGGPCLDDVPAAEHLFAGLVMLADWLGSDRSVFLFADDPVAAVDPMPIARARARRLVRERFLAADDLRDACRVDFGVFDRPPIRFEPRPAQSAMDAIPLAAPTEASLTVLESETGSGKTEAAIHRFAQLFRAGAVDGMYFALPTRTSATQIHRRVVDAVASTFASLPVEERPPVVLAVPGYLRVDDQEGQALPQFQFLWPDGKGEANRHRTWAAENSKRFLSGSVVIGTIDQVLLSTLVVGHAHLRATTLSRLLLVVDEVHASDAYMTALLDQVLGWHFTCGGHALLMSATLGTTAQRRFFERLRMKSMLAQAPKRAAGALAEACASPYPVVHHATRARGLESLAVTAPGSVKRCTVELSDVIDDADAIASRALRAARQGAQVLVLRNTVAAAVATQVALESLASRQDQPLLFRVGEQVTLHHARFVEDDRRLLDDAVEARLGKNAPRRTGSVVVATQTVQQSLDLDADFLITDLCPMDVLLQRIGRLHRHTRPAEARPPEYGAPRCVVLDPGELTAILDERGVARGRNGYAKVYQDMRVLEATRRLLAEHPQLTIPTENRMLVERTTHPEALDGVATACGAAMLAHASRMVGKDSSEIGFALSHSIDRTVPIGEYGYPPREATARIGTRLGEADRLVEFAAPFQSSFGAQVRRIKIPHWLAPGWPADLQGRATPSGGGATIEVTDPDGKVLGRFLYDRLGLRAEGAIHTPATEREADE